MQGVRPAPLSLLFLFTLGSPGCGSQEAGGQVVAGLTTDMAVGFDLDRVDITAAVNGRVTREEPFLYGKGTLSLPAEIPFPSAQGGASVELTAKAFRKGEETPFVIQRAKTQSAAGQTLLLPLALEQACADIACPEGLACAHGQCANPFINSSNLSEFDLDWLVSAPDACKSPASGAPVMEIGQGAHAFATLQDGEAVTIEPGSQGGHHVWLALRLSGIRQMGSVLRIVGTFPDLAFELLPFQAQITLRKAGLGLCEVYGVRFQVDRGITADAIAGQPLDMAVSLEDPNGTAVSGNKRVVIAP